MQYLDILKKGTETVNIKSREAIRYLEQRFKYLCHSLKAQKESERDDFWSKDGHFLYTDLNDPNQQKSIYIPKNMREILSCCRYYQYKVAPPPLDESDTTFLLVSDNENLLNIAAGIEIRSTTFQNFLQSRKKTKKRRNDFSHLQ